MEDLQDQGSTASLLNGSFGRLYMNSVRSIVVDGIRGLDISPLVGFELTQTRTLLTVVLDRSNVLIVQLQHLDISKAGVLASVVALETPV